MNEVVLLKAGQSTSCILPNCVVAHGRSHSQLIRSPVSNMYVLISIMSCRQGQSGFCLEVFALPFSQQTCQLPLTFHVCSPRDKPRKCWFSASNFSKLAGEGAQERYWEYLEGLATWHHRDKSGDLVQDWRSCVMANCHRPRLSAQHTDVLSVQIKFSHINVFVML